MGEALAVLVVLAAIVFLLFMAIVGFVIGICWRGLITSITWNWFMPVIFGLPHVTFWQAVGLNVVAAGLIWAIKPSKDNMSKEDMQNLALNGFVGTFIHGGMILLIGYVAKCYMGA